MQLPQIRAGSVNNSMEAYEQDPYLQMPQKSYQYQVKQQKNFKLPWTTIDPQSSMDALQLVSWQQELDIKILIRVKLAQQGLRMDSASEANLQDYIKMKQKLARRIETVGDMGLKKMRRSAPTSPQRRNMQTPLQKTYKIC